MQTTPSTLLLWKIIMSEKTCLLLSILLISVVFFFTLPTAGRVLQADAPAQEGMYYLYSSIMICKIQNLFTCVYMGKLPTQRLACWSWNGLKHFWYDHELWFSCVMADNYESTQSGNGRSKIGVRGSKSNPTKSATGQSSPSQASPTRTSSRATIRSKLPSLISPEPVSTCLMCFLWVIYSEKWSSTFFKRDRKSVV